MTHTQECVYKASMSTNINTSRVLYDDTDITLFIVENDTLLGCTEYDIIGGRVRVSVRDSRVVAVHIPLKGVLEVYNPTFDYCESLDAMYITLDSRNGLACIPGIKTISSISHDVCIDTVDECIVGVELHSLKFSVTLNKNETTDC